MTAGTGQHIWVQMWGPDGEVIADGVLEPGSDCDFAFTEGPQPVQRWSLTRITHEDAERLAAEKGVKQVFGDDGYVNERRAGVRS